MRSLLFASLLALPLSAQLPPDYDLNRLNDEFTDEASITKWQRLNDVEQWGADQLETYGVGKTVPGKLVMIPYSSTWYGDFRGDLSFKSVTGDFVVTTDVDASRRGGGGAPRSSYSLGGIMARAPRSITKATWTPGGENYVFLSLGSADQPGTFQNEVKTTVNSQSTLAITPAPGGRARIQVARIGSAFLMLRQPEGGAWTVHRRFSRADLPETLQVGLTTYTDWDTVKGMQPLAHNSTVVKTGNPDLEAAFDYVRFRRPNVPGELAGKDFTNPSAVSDEQLLAFLGANANAPNPVSHTFFLPGAAEIPGQNGAYFSSTLWVTNLDDKAANVSIGFIPYSGKTVPISTVKSLAAGETQVFTGVLATLFGLSSDSGTLALASEARLAYQMTTFNSAGIRVLGGVYGLALSPVHDADLFTAGETGHMLWASQGSTYRTNVSLVLTDPNSSVELRVLDSAGVSRGTTVVSSAVPVSYQAALSAIAGDAALDVARVELRVLAGRATGYTVVNDNLTGDGIAAQAERAPSGATDLLLNGVARTAGANGSHWSTDLRLVNPGDAAITVSLEPIGIARPWEPLARTVAAKGTIEIADLLGPAGFSFPEGVAGGLRLRSTAPFLTAARTSNVDPSAVRRGTFSAYQKSVPYSSFTGTGCLGVFTGIENSKLVPGFRSNLALLAGPSGATGFVVLRDQKGSTELERTPFSLSAAEWTQRNADQWFPNHAQIGNVAPEFPSNSRIDVTLTSGSLDSYTSRIDNATGDAVIFPQTVVCP